MLPTSDRALIFNNHKLSCGLSNMPKCSLCTEGGLNTNFCPAVTRCYVVYYMQFCSKDGWQLEMFFLFFFAHFPSAQWPFQVCTIAYYQLIHPPTSGLCFYHSDSRCANWIQYWRGNIDIYWESSWWWGWKCSNPKFSFSVFVVLRTTWGLKTDKYILWQENNTPSSEASTGSKIFWIFHSDNVPQFLASRHSLLAAAADWKCSGLPLSSLSQLWLRTESQRPEVAPSEVTTVDSVHSTQYISFKPLKCASLWRSNLLSLNCCGLFLLIFYSFYFLL